MDDWQQWFERVWGFREEELYPRLFGVRNTEGIYVLTFDRFKKRFETDQVDPRWLTHGVLRYQPTPSSPSWKHATSGLSNPWEADGPDPSEVSGLGLEFVFETDGDYPWALDLTLNILAFQLLLAAGRFGEDRVINDFDRIPLHGSIDGEQSNLTHLLVVPAINE